MRLWIACFIAAGCSGAAATHSIDGAELFAHYCARCHGANGKPPEQMAAQIGVRDLTSAELRAKVTPALVEQQIRAGSANKLMPAFEGLIKDPQIKALAAWVASPAFLEPR